MARAMLLYFECHVKPNNSCTTTVNISPVNAWTLNDDELLELQDIVLADRRLIADNGLG
jgi:hypothetical protein